MRRALAIVLALGGIAHADPNRVDVEVGKTVEKNVGYARGGWFCDDATLVTAELVTRADTNYWIVKGAKAGTTTCRVGTDLHRPTVVFTVVVAAPKAKPK